ncbi:hypothetical protein HPP92_019657 [Vanilla planifolia]|uniref:Uncharacterized protein n=1 Tax=Vanilla planifolia TaxID=51239 RepID=A0A835Q664_VANPL|nr:hypothetical protein HPP92_019657 [Vanilla planifolia]
MAVGGAFTELPKLLVSFAPLSDKCEELSGRIIERLVTICSPREMLSVLCEALASETNDSKELGYRGHVLFGLAKEDRDSVNDLFSAAISIGSSIREISLDMRWPLISLLNFFWPVSNFLLIDLENFVEADDEFTDCFSRAVKERV